MMMKYSAIILLGGKSTRFGGEQNKVYYRINNKPIFCYPLELFLSDKDCFEVIVVYNFEDLDILNNILKDYPNVIKTVGGSMRHLSVLEGIKKANCNYVLVHDGARPNINLKMLNDLKDELAKSDAVSLGVRVTDTIKKVTSENIETVDRSNLFAVQTPQGCVKNILMDALSKVKLDDNITDDLMAIEKYTNAVSKIIIGSKENIKVTTLEDYRYVKFLMGDKNV